MSTITLPNVFAPNDLLQSATTNANNTTIYNDYNGSISNVNIASNAAIADTKLAQITTSQKVNLSAVVASSQAQGDVFYASSATVISRLGAGTSGQFLQTAGAAANPAWAFAFAKNKLISTTRDVSLTSQWAITGVGFTPKQVICLWNIDAQQSYGVGYADSAKSAGAFGVANNTASKASTSLAVFSPANNTNYNLVTVTSYDADGATFDFSKTGSPTGTANVYFLFMG